VLCAAATLSAAGARHDPGGLPPRVVNSVDAVQLVAVEETRDAYVLVLKNTSERVLVRLDWTSKREEERRSGAFEAPDGGVAAGSVFDVPVPHIDTPHDEHEEIPEEELEAHRQTIVLEVASFAGGAAGRDPKRAW
jgi:hypothetical protein